MNNLNEIVGCFSGAALVVAVGGVGAGVGSGRVISPAQPVSQLSAGRAHTPLRTQPVDFLRSCACEVDHNRQARRCDVGRGRSASRALRLAERVLTDQSVLLAGVDRWCGGHDLAVASVGANARSEG
ncbi:hypothetical protein Pcinc_035572 [Petrolisthes cinctipes]|uniref:Uncharacterized protein n=1 Tax=Petrolisthes cinctipes TaxID=88211 RepID=A0AAE1BY19_PETCI|nr:hypothetical protein Pcinc_035572 [Petrolisthes cinctipes]